MWKFASAVGTVMAVLWGASAVAQTPAPGAVFPAMRTLAATSGTGLSNGPLIDRPEIRMVRVDVEPGGVRMIHTHDDVRYHLLVPITGSVQVNLDSPNPVPLVPWQPHFFAGGTRHGFQNTGTSKVSVMEIFVKP